MRVAPERDLRLTKEKELFVRQGHFACLTYHVIGENSSQYTVSRSQFRSHLAFLESEGYFVDDFEGLEANLVSQHCIPDRYVVLTIDDGHESSMSAAEVLQSYGSRATFFLTRDRCLSRDRFIRKSDIRELRKAGFSIGTHGTSHRKLTFLPVDACAAELTESKEWLENVLGEPVRHMAAPGGFINRRVSLLAYRFGYTLVGTCREHMNSASEITVPGIVNRVNIRKHFSIGDLSSTVNGQWTFYAWRQIRSAALVIPKQVLR